jgi:4-hydroxy-tetrahydrodipicolinate synthase
VRFSGVYTALVTPFAKNGSVDESALRRLVDRQIESGVTGLVPMGTTGESPTLDHEEHIHVIEIVVDEANGRVPIIAGTGSNSTSEAVEMTKYAAEIGVDATLQVAPYYNKPTAEGFYRHFSTIADSVDLPLVIYNIPGRTGKNIENDTTLRLARHPNIQGVKEASGNFAQIMDLLAERPETLSVLSGDDNIAFPMVALGADGVISVASNLVPDRMVKFIDAALAGKNDEARSMHYELLPLFVGLFFETNPIPVKYALSKLGVLEESYRLPMCPMSDANKKRLDEILSSLGIS